MALPALILLVCFCLSAQAQIPANARSAITGDTVVSQSQRFIVHSRSSAFFPSPTGPGQIVVEPELLAVTAERIHKALAAEIPALNARGGDIHLLLLNDGAPNMSIPVQATLFNDGWEYRIGIPPVVEEKRLVKGLVTVILAEYANRQAPRSADLPPWLIEGLTRQLFHGVGPSLVVDRRSVGFELAARDLHAATRALLRTNSPPTFSDLTAQAVPSEATPQRAVYEASSHLLVHSLLRLPQGPQRFGVFLKLLPANWNWQTSFLHSFGFNRMLDAEKWWALASLEYVTRDVAQAWSEQASLNRLEDLLVTPVEVRSATNSVPSTKNLALRQLLDTEWSAQKKALEEKSRQLNYLSIHLAPGARSLAGEYRAAIESYLNRRQQILIKANPRIPKSAQERIAAQDAQKKFAALDEKLAALSRRGLTAAR